MLPFQILQLRMFPPIAIIIPLLFMFVYLHLWDTLWGLVILYGAVTFPFVVWLMRSFFQEVPREISDAAIVDGCTHWGAFFKVVLPQVKGGLAATALFVFILNWSDFLIALVMTQDNARTAPVFLQALQAGERRPGVRQAGCPRRHPDPAAGDLRSRDPEVPRPWPHLRCDPQVSGESSAGPRRGASPDS